MMHRLAQLRRALIPLFALAAFTVSSCGPDSREPTPKPLTLRWIRGTRAKRWAGRAPASAHAAAATGRAQDWKRRIRGIAALPHHCGACAQGGS